MQENKLYFARIHKDARLPSKRDEDGAYDIYAVFDENEAYIQPHELRIFKTGLKTAFSPKYRMVLKERGSTGSRCMAVRMGLIDSGYRDEIMVGINNTSSRPIVITKTPDAYYGEEYVVYPYDKAIAQAKMERNPEFNVIEIKESELMKIFSERGTGKLGSSGK